MSRQSLWSLMSPQPPFPTFNLNELLLHVLRTSSLKEKASQDGGAIQVGWISGWGEVYIEHLTVLIRKHLFGKSAGRAFSRIFQVFWAASWQSVLSLLCSPLSKKDINSQRCYQMANMSQNGPISDVENSWRLGGEHPQGFGQASNWHMVQGPLI